MKQKTAILLGATGLTGSFLLNRLIADESYTSIKLFSRKSSGNSSPKIKEFTGDVLQPDQFKGAFIMKLTNPLLVGSMKKYRAIEADCIAAAMVSLAKSDHTIPIVESNLIQELSSGCQ
jgi:aspartate-semialdehyde dehydrogenase